MDNDQTPVNGPNVILFDWLLDLDVRPTFGQAAYGRVHQHKEKPITVGNNNYVTGLTIYDDVGFFYDQIIAVSLKSSV